MKPRLETERLVLRPFEPDDAAALHALWNEPEVGRFLWDGEAVSHERVLEQIEVSRRNFDAHGFGYFVVMDREAPETVIGFAGLRHRHGCDGVELMYALHPQRWGQGLATEASRAVLRFALEECRLAEVWAGADPPNHCSFRVMHRLGMTFVEDETVAGRLVRYHRLESPGELGGPQ